MGRMLNLLCEALALYAISAGFVIGLLYFSGFHFSNGLTTYGLVGFLIVLAPMSFVAATRGSWIGEGSVDRTAPVRPLEMLAPAATVLLRSSELPVIGGRQSFRIAFSGEGMDSIDVVDRLAGHLTKLGIAHSHVGAIDARDGSAHWRLEPVLGERQLDGWVEAAESTDRTSVIAAVADFLKQDLKLSVEVSR